jgi:sporulation protein YlmC with PRC-barrel domain
MQDVHETSSLIGANKVEGTSVFNQTGEELGKIHEIMIDKVSGNVAYAVMAFGGVFGMGEKYCPLPWSSLTYDTELQGYVADLSKEALKNAPEYDVDNPTWNPAYEERLRQYYGPGNF